MKNIDAYMIYNGDIFEDEEDAKKAELDLIGEALDGLLPFDDRGNITHVARHNLLMKQLEDKELKRKITNLYLILTYND